MPAMGSRDQPGHPQSATKGIDAFASVAATYEEWYGSPLGAFVDDCEKQALDDSLRDVEAGSIIEIGAGTGHIARWLAGSGRQVTAVEPSPAMREEGRRRTAGLPICWYDARAEALPFPEACFDGAVFFSTLEFVHRPAAALRNEF